MRVLVVISVVSFGLLGLLGSCRFDVSGTAHDDDDDQPAAIDAAVGADGASQPQLVDAAAVTPEVQCGAQVCGGTTICCADLGGQSCTTPDACNGATMACDGPSDCPGQDCCQYVGLWTGCADGCQGGDILCDAPSDCPSDTECCASGLGAGTCQSFCF
jgi:hypothetical protein